MTEISTTASNPYEWSASELERVTHCPVCAEGRRMEELNDLPDRVFGTAGGTWNIQRCLGCRSIYLDPRPNQATIGLAYRNYFTHSAGSASPPKTLVQSLSRAIGNSYRNRVFGMHLRPSLPLGWMLAQLFPTTARRVRREGRGLERLAANDRRILDVGCGNGEFLVFAQKMGWRCYGVDNDSAAAAVSHAQGIEILGSELADLGERYEGFFDAVTLSHVIEHLHDPIEVLRQCRRVMKSGGYLWVETPNIDSVGYEIYGRCWRGLEPPRHLVMFSHASLRFSLERAGFEGIEMLPPWDSTRHIFELSALIRAGYIAEIEKGALSLEARGRVEAEISRAVSIVRRNPERAEFVGAIAHSP
jgi:2-polyprenyl-3-methyl-5-hydroxy-6-metoxy-1,4-benzoquinol methylase